jgi:hypothetical protein
VKAVSRVLTPFPRSYYGEDSLIVETSPYPWQKYILSKLNSAFDPRRIYWIWDPSGSTGKSFFQKYLYWTRQKEVLILPIASVKDVTYLRAQNPEATIILCNFTRTFSRAEALREIYSSIESLKDGIFTSVKYQSKFVSTSHPHIVIFSNFLPHMHSMSIDRWEILRVTSQDKGYVRLEQAKWLELSRDYEDYIAHLYYYQKNPQGYIKNYVEVGAGRHDVIALDYWDIAPFYKRYGWTENMETNMKLEIPYSKLPPMASYKLKNYNRASRFYVAKEEARASKREK